MASGVGLLALAGCSSAPPAAHTPAAGSYPVASPGQQVLATPTASDTHYQLVSAGDAVRADLGPAQLVAQVSGPDLTVPPGPPPDHAQGVLTVRLRSEQGPATVPADSFLLLDQARSPIPVRSDAASVQVAPGAPAVLHLSADLPTGHATLTWQPTGHPMVTWDFVVEVD